MTPVEIAYFTGLAMGSVHGLVFGLLLAYVIIPRSIDIWARIVRRNTRRHVR